MEFSLREGSIGPSRQRIVKCATASKPPSPCLFSRHVIGCRALRGARMITLTPTRGRDATVIERSSIRCEKPREKLLLVMSRHDPRVTEPYVDGASLRFQSPSLCRNVAHWHSECFSHGLAVNHSEVLWERKRPRRLRFASSSLTMK
jgi:hypothetical protein